MKKIFVVISLFSVIFLPVVSCKKGSNDPFLSLRSRNTRVIGVWELTKIQGISTVTTKSRYSKDVTVTKTVISFKYDETTDTYIKVTSSPTGFERDSTYKEVLYINENGTFVDSIYSKKADAKILNTRSLINSWYWIDTKKKKTGIVLKGLGEFVVQGLSYKKLILTSSGVKTKNINGSTTSESTINGETNSLELTFKRKE